MPQKETVVEHFDQWADQDRWSGLYDESTDVVRSYNFVARMRRVEELSEPVAVAGAKVLDIGCGTGVSAPFYLDRGCSYRGIDISAQMVEQARERVKAGGAAFAVGDVEKGLDASDGAFDLVVGLGLLEYLDDLDAACDEIVRVTRPGGTIIISVPRRLCPQNIAKTLLSPVVTRLWGLVKRLRGLPLERHGVYHRRFRDRELDALFARRGCTRTGGAHYNLEVTVYPLNRVLPGLGLAIKRRVERHQNTCLGLFGTGYILRCQRGTGKED